MDWVQVLLVLLFIIFPLLEGLASRRRRPPADQEPSASLPDIPTREPAALPDSDSSAWDAWFGPEATAQRAEAEQEEERVAEEIQPIEAISLEPVDEIPEPVRVERVTVPEAAAVDRMVEHERFHARYLAPAEVPRDPERLQERLRKPGELRRAVLLTEILGPPRSLQ